MPFPDLCLQDRQVRQGSGRPWQREAEHVRAGSAGGTGVCRREAPAARVGGGGRGRGQIGADSYSSKDKDLFCVRRTSLCSDTFVRTPALALLGVHCSPIFLTRKQRPGEVRKQTQGPLPVSDQAKV